MNVWRAWSVLLGVCLLLGCAPEAAPADDGRKIIDGTMVHYRPWDKPALELDLVLQERGGLPDNVVLYEYRKGCVHSVSPRVLLSAEQGVEGRALLSAEQRARYAQASLPLTTRAAAPDSGLPDAQVPAVQPARTLGLVGTPTAGDDTEDTIPSLPPGYVEPDTPGLIGPCKGGEAAIEEPWTADRLEIYINLVGHLSVRVFAFAPETSDPSVVELLTYLRGLLAMAAPQLP